MSTDSREQHRQKLARIALDEMYQFVALLDAQGTLLEVNRAALERASGGEFVRYDVEIFGRAGERETIVIDFSLIPVRDESGRVAFMVPEGREFSEKKIYELQIASAIAAVDHEKLQRVLMNLLSNAFKFTPEGGIIRCGLAQDLDSSKLVLWVEDSGPGVRQELRASMFERFQQGEGGNNRSFGGTGLGLAIAKQFVDLHQGLIELGESSLGGAFFRVSLPLRRLSPEQVPVRGLVQAHRGSASITSSSGQGTTFLISLTRDSRPA